MHYWRRIGTRFIVPYLFSRGEGAVWQLEPPSSGIDSTSSSSDGPCLSQTGTIDFTGSPVTPYTASSLVIMVGPIEERLIKQRRLASEKKKRAAAAAASAEGHQPKKQRKASETSSQEDEVEPPSYFEAVQAMPGQRQQELRPANPDKNTQKVPARRGPPATSLPDTRRKSPPAKPAAQRSIPPNRPTDDDNTGIGGCAQNKREAPRVSKSAVASRVSSAPFHDEEKGLPPPSRVDAVDEVIWEAQNLLQSAAEAQALGRLRSANSFLLLAHQRMIGLGRRVDRSYCECDGDGSEERDGDTGEKAEDGKQPADKPEGSGDKKRKKILPPLISQPPLPPQVSDASNDLAYVEHLARSSMELHSKRTGRQLAREVEGGRAATQEKIKLLEREHNQIMVLAHGTLGVADIAGGGRKKAAANGSGRGRKPPALVMHTMVGQNQDVRELMNGILK